ncbi:hypothetical protein ALTERO38_51266 [Alteromonas sp. 38]|nr:hypothetical protein ALTER154_70449 [Alteromonas sp. 154]VXB66600.1 hypothetical protein ALTERO38_51266 [Alteromonas sp. 38]
MALPRTSVIIAKKYLPLMGALSSNWHMRSSAIILIYADSIKIRALSFLLL